MATEEQNQEQEQQNNNENLDNQGQNVNVNENQEQQNQEQNQEQEQQQQQPNNNQINEEEIALNFLKSKGLEFNSIEDLKEKPKVVEVEKVVNEFEDVMDEDTKKYLQAKKKHNISKEEFDFLKKIDELPKLELARLKVKEEAGVDFSNEQIDEYLEETLGIDISNLTNTDLIKLASFSKTIYDQKKALKEKVFSDDVAAENTANKNENQDKNQNQPEYVKLEDGSIMLKSDYDSIVDKKQKLIQETKAGLDSVKAASFNVVLDENGQKQTVDFVYEYSQEDKHGMLSSVEKIDEIIKTRYYDQQGNFKSTEYAEDLRWTDKEFREKAIGSIINKAIAYQTEKILKERGNVNFDPNKPLDKQQKEGVTIVPVKDILSGR